MAIVDMMSKVEEFAPKKPEYLLGKGATMPYNNHNSSTRKKMLSIHKEHQTQLINGQQAYVSTGYSTLYSEFNSSLKKSDSVYKVIAKISKYSHLPEHNYILVLYDESRNFYTIEERKGQEYLTESNGYIYDNSNIDSKQVGDYFCTNEVIRKSASMDEYGNYLDGTNVLVGYMDLANTCEDGIQLNEESVHMFDSPEIQEKSFVINDNQLPLNLYGEFGDYKACPNVGEPITKDYIVALRQVRKEDEDYTRSYNRLRQPMISDRKISIGGGTVVDIEVFCNNPELLNSRVEYKQFKDIYENQTRYTKEICDVLSPIVADKTAKRSFELEYLYLYHSRVLQGQSFSLDRIKAYSFLNIKFRVLNINTISEGDKVTNGFGGKGVIAKIVPASEMPLLDNGKRLDMVVNSLGVVGRLNPGQHLEQETTFIGSRIIEYIRKGVFPPELAEEEYLRYMKLFSPNEYQYILNRLDNMTELERGEYINDVCSYDAIHINIEPISEAYGIDLLDKAYKEFDYVKPYNIMVAQETSDNNIRMIPGRRTLIAGYVYYLRLKQHAEEKFSVTSLSATNIRNQNSRSKLSKNGETPHSRTPISFGSMEIGNLEHLNPELVITMLMLHSASPHGRRLAIKLLTDDPYDTDVQLTPECENINATVMHVYLKAIGLRMVFRKQKKQMIRPASLVAGRVLPKASEMRTFKDNYDMIHPATIVTQEEQLYKQQNPTSKSDLKNPAYLVGGHVIQKDKAKRSEVYGIKTNDKSDK